MSNIYIHEPPTLGKVCLNTSVGDIDIELWSKETPKACRNFVQLCLEGYYNGTIFHRVVRDFIAQGGDPTGTGHGGESIYGKTFKDEFHTRLRFVRRGLVAMANAGPNDNGSQFFFTLGAAPELDKKHTIFGKVTGHTLYNMLKFADLETDSNERPMFPPKIYKTKVILNPFDDIVPRIIEKKSEDKPKKRKHTSKATKNFKLLSFGEEAEEDEEEVNKVSQNMKHKSKSSHDLLDDGKLSSRPAVDTTGSSEGQGSPSRTPSEERGHKRQVDDDSDSESEEKRAEKAATLERIKKKLKKDEESSSTKVKDKSKDKAKVKDKDEEKEKPKELSKLEELKKEAKQLKKEIQASRNPKVNEEKSTDKGPSLAQNSVIAAYEEERRKYEDRKMSRKKSSREQETLDILAKFKTRLSSTRTLTEYEEDDEEDKEEDKEEEEEEEDPNDLTWMNHRLNFESHEKKVLDANVHDTDRYEIYDPRNPLTKRRREASKQSRKEKR